VTKALRALEGLADVCAAGDGIQSDFKQGGLATQQADIAAECIAAGLGAPLKPPPFEPMLRGVAPMYMRASSVGEGEAAASALWWPPTKIAGRYLGPYLAFASTLSKHSPLEDRAARASDPERTQDAHREARELALVFAEADARGGDFASALRWLEIIEQLDGVLQSDTSNGGPPGARNPRASAGVDRAPRPGSPARAGASQTAARLARPSGSGREQPRLLAAYLRLRDGGCVLVCRGRRGRRGRRGQPASWCLVPCDVSTDQFA
jgi:hypothetical protein